ncbi:RidA family protein [Candidatus Aquiluna sp. UB-MaderosW2red]|uniref:RidA family protein n=1 Tax=Candidatus Aquiluna sp. UB-MaderosW2red TaxID=1855377 RepID=UPI000875B0F0|nr:RidA family protein [Candidatus Aquiluna sp. UB-MaderosW2red]SCX14714.1 Enamine deaminase RidA, house cleaning of reactive enamine intermediates, YjgF/YER057c/UK114 family [Candidatus Aquiluna sp. UB-MaderosW2red]
MSVEQRILDLGLELPNVAAPAGAYLPAIVSGNLVFTAGQLPLIDGQLMATGKLGAGIEPEQAKAMAARCLLNALAATKGVIGNLDRITKIVKVVGFVASTPDFTAQPSVINGASELLESIFGELGRHARSSVGVASLPLDSPVEIELIIEFL